MDKNLRTNVEVEVKRLLEGFDWIYTDKGVNACLDEWQKNKADLLNIFEKHPNYVEGMGLIACDQTYTRVSDPDAISNFFYWLKHNVIANTRFIGALPQEVRLEMSSQGKRMLPDKVYTWLCEEYSRFEVSVPDEFYEACKEEVPDAHIGKGSRTSRALNKLFKYLGYDKHEDYNKMFAKFADAINPLTVVKHTILSVNPVDYLTMSFGNSWSSCHTIDTFNTRNMPNGYRGQFCSGTMSYMLDGTSMVLYTVESSYDGDNFPREPKISRQMFHYADGRLIQGRLYPAYDDNASIKANREFVQSVLTTALDIPNMWTPQHRGDIYDIAMSYGTHYRDYTEFNHQCNYSVISGYEHTDDFIDIGHDPICIECGKTHGISEYINCCHYHAVAVCEHCGDGIDSHHSVVTIDGHTYCSYCVTACRHCGEYHLTSDMRNLSGVGYVCDNCRDNYVMSMIMGSYIPVGDAVYVENLCTYTTPSYLEDRYEKCPKCGRWYMRVYSMEYEDYICPSCSEDEIVVEII